MESSPSTQSVLTRLYEVFREVFDDDDLTIGPHTTAADVEGWDSLQHVTLILSIERAFGIKFTSKQVAKLENVGEMAALVEKLMQDKSA